MSRTGNSLNEDQEKAVEMQGRPEGGTQSRDPWPWQGGRLSV